MNIKIDPNLGTVRVDVTTDIDHLAKYRLFIWKKVGGKWTLQPNAVDPEYSTSADPSDHTITIPTASLQACLLQLVASVYSLVKTPGNLDLKVHVQQDPADPTAPVAKPAAAYPANYTQPVPFGMKLQVVASYPFEFA